MNNIRTLPVFACILLVFSSLHAQQYVGRTGILDANPRVGSGGLNNANNRTPYGLLMPQGNLYMTGNVTGGARFQGLVPYRSAGEMGGILGSDTLSNFRRDSVGVDNLTTAAPPPIRPYLDPARQVTQTIGNRVVDTGTVFQSTVTPTGARLTSPYGMDGARPFARSTSRRLTTETNIPALPWEAPPATATLPLEKLPPPEKPENLLTEQSEKVDTRVETEVVPGTMKQEPDTSPEMMIDEMRRLPKPGEAETRMKGPAGQEFVPETQQCPRDLRRMDLSTTYRRQFELNLERGQNLIGQGLFYQAADAYELAIQYQPGDVRGYASKAYALMAAGEYMSAAFFLEKAFELDSNFPAHLELGKLISDEKVITKRLAEIDNWQERSGQPALLFLSAYVKFQQGDKLAAETALKKAIEITGQTPAYTALMSLIQGVPSSESAPLPAAP